MTAPHDGAPRPAPLRLLLVYDTLYPETIGGIEHRQAELAAALARAGHAVTLAAFTDREESPDPRVRLLSLGRRPSAAGTRRGGGGAAAIARAMLRLPVADFDVVETANVPFAHLLPLALRCRAADTPLLITWHEVWGANWLRFARRRTLGALFAAGEFLGAQVGDEVHAVSRLTARRLERYRAGGAVRILPNGITGERVRAAAEGAPPGAPPLVCAGRLTGDKRIDLAVQAAALLARRVRGPLLRVIGEGPEEEALRKLARELRISDRVEFTGKLPDAPAVWRAVAGARVVLHPSLREGFGIFPLEAMALGLPVVFCPAPDNAVPELVRDGIEGIAAAATPGVVADAAWRLLSRADVHASMSAAALRRSAEFEWSTVAAAFEGRCRALARKG
jgi:glycosyltransferase involved in cell wall biosynthesis